MKISIVPFVLIFTALLFFSCSDYVATPKPLAFPRIDFPAETIYRTFSNGTCPFTFEYPAIAAVSRDAADSCWVDISFPQYDTKWYITYRNASENGKSRAQHFEEYRTLVYKHTKKATEIKETQVAFPSGYGTLFEIYGSVGTPAELFVSDTAGQNIAMLSCYYRTAEKNDSLAPVTSYMKAQIAHALETLKWK